MNENARADIGLFETACAVFSALLCIAGSIVLKLWGFFKPPLPVHFGEKEGFWFPLATLGAVVACGLVFFLWSRIKKKNGELKLPMGLTIVVLGALFAVAVTYFELKWRWTLGFQGKVVLTGDQYTPEAMDDAKQQGVTAEEVFKDFGYRSDAVWTEPGLQNRELCLGLLYTLTAMLGGFSWGIVSYWTAGLVWQSRRMPGQRPHASVPTDQARNYEQVPGLESEVQCIQRSEAPSVFISYAHADNESADPKQRWLDRFLKFLKPFVRQNVFTVSSDRDIGIGDDWNARIQSQLAVARAAVVLISPDFLASDYVANNELPVLLKKATDNGTKIFPIIISPCPFEVARFKYPDPEHGPNEFRLSSLQSATPPEKTLVEMGEGEQNRVFTTVAEQLAELLTLNP
jgi:TIR domain